MKKYLEILKKCPLFFGINEEELLRMLSCLGARVTQFDKKYTVFAEGAPSRYIGIVLSGSAQISRVDYYGNKSILSTVGAGDIFAEAFACAGVDPLPVSIIASEASEMMFIDRDRVLRTCPNGCGFHHQLIYNLMRDLAVKSIELHRRTEITSKRTTREKLMAYLLEFAKEERKDSFEIPFDRQELADYLEVDRSGLSAEIGKLRREGVIQSKKRRFKIL